jgi:hypothetical protein
LLWPELLFRWRWRSPLPRRMLAAFVNRFTSATALIRKRINAPSARQAAAATTAAAP